MFLVSSDCHHMPDDAWWWQQNTGSRLSRNSLVAADVRFYAVFSQPAFDVVQGTPFQGDVLSRNSTGWTWSPGLQVLRLSLTNLVAHEWLSISCQIWLWVSCRHLFMLIETGWLAHHPPTCRSTKGGWQRQTCQLTSKNTQNVIMIIWAKSDILIPNWPLTLDDLESKFKLFRMLLG